MVVGGGPAGVSSAIYSTRKGLKVTVVAEKFGGQLTETVGIENFISSPYTTGKELTSNLLNHAKEYDISHVRDSEMEIQNTSHFLPVK